jgi:hypothetical protein
MAGRSRRQVHDSRIRWRAADADLQFGLSLPRPVQTVREVCLRANRKSARKKIFSNAVSAPVIRPAIGPERQRQNT